MPSAVWDHFEREKDNDPICRHCGKSVKNKEGNTSNLTAHLQTRHFMIYTSFQRKRPHSPSPVRNVVSFTTTSDIQGHEDADGRNHEDGHGETCIGLYELTLNCLSYLLLIQKFHKFKTLLINLYNSILFQECLTRWGSTHKMIARVLKNRRAVRRVLNDDRETVHLVPTWQNLEILEAIDAAIASLADFTDIMSGSKYST